jgi:hypothetical protein
MLDGLVHVSVVEDREESLLMRDVTIIWIDLESFLDVSLGERIALLVEINLCDLKIEFGGVRADLEAREEESAVIFPIEIAGNGSRGEKEKTWRREEEREDREEERLARGEGGEERGEESDDAEGEGLEEDGEEVAVACGGIRRGSTKRGTHRWRERRGVSPRAESPTEGRSKVQGGRGKDG